MKPQAGGKPPLSRHRAFVIQFRAETDVTAGRFAGRVEHVVSGQATHFQSLDGLLVFFTRILMTVRTQPPQRPSA